MRKFGKFLVDIFVKNIPIKLLAIGLALLTVILINV